MGELSSSSAFSRSTLTRIIVYSLYFFYYLLLNSAHVEGFDSLLRLPHSGASRTRPRSKRVFYVNDFGAKGDGVNDDTKAFEDVWKLVCSFPSRAKVIIPAGKTYLVRPIIFGGPCRSKLTLEISGTIIAPKDPDAWAGLNPQKWLEFQRVNHLTVEGGGIIEGMGQEWWARSCKINTTNPCHHAPTALIFHRCKNLKVRNLMILNSQQMHMAFTSCDRVAASHLRVLAPGSSPNTDGIHISASTRVQIKNSVIGTVQVSQGVEWVMLSSGIVVKGPATYLVWQLFGYPDQEHHLWTRPWYKIHDVVVDGAFLSNTENGVRIKSWQGGSGFATNIAFQNVWMENVSNPIIIDQYYCDSPVTCQNQSLAVKVEDISFVGIKGTSATEEAIKFACSETFPCERLYLEDIQLVSYSGDSTRSFCWEAQGSCSGLVYPPPCFSYNDSSYIEQKVLSSSVLWSI
ncbi:hypothetical protein RHGRI_024887 [Rhododendron griersonianum]|uniref:endo-polygalacturonase n=1 Tax=Rhododendron griersonianum TaxID=479676 RepID=A0AAV6JDD2_9ERIC|nr:hypothetical protein RHGRI_024887 [Rhododendron griersonianum]